MAIYSDAPFCAILLVAGAVRHDPGTCYIFKTLQAPMSVHQLPDGRWICKWSADGKQRKEYFGRGPWAEDQARARNAELGGIGVAKKALATPTFADLANGYMDRKKTTFSAQMVEKVGYKIARLIESLGRMQAHELTVVALTLM